MAFTGWVQIYETTLTGAATSLTISGLAGNTDIEYRLRVRQIAGANSEDIYLRPNNDSTAGAYGYQKLYGTNTTAAATRDTSVAHILMGNSAVSGDSTLSDVIIYAKSGYVRTCIICEAAAIVTTTIDNVYLSGAVWNNTTDEITSLVLNARQTNGLGIGTYISLWARGTISLSTLGAMTTRTSWWGDI